MKDDPGRDQPPERGDRATHESDTAEFILEPRPSRPPSHIVELPSEPGDESSESMDQRRDAEAAASEVHDAVGDSDLDMLLGSLNDEAEAESSPEPTEGLSEEPGSASADRSWTW